MCALDDRGIGLRVGRRLVVVPIGNAEAAAEIDVAQAWPSAMQVAGELGEQRDGVVEGLRGP